MPKIIYKEFNFRSDSLNIIELSNGIIEEYSNQGYNLTLRQLYYQLVARGYIENNEKSYKRIGNIINDGRISGLIDWNAISDRTRNMKQNNHWSSPQQIIRTAIDQYAINTRADQEIYVEVWVEKEALVDIVQQACQKLDVPYFACRGYVSQSEMWAAAQRFINSGKESHIIHLGDHDPSGIDMTRDINDRLEMFEAYAEVTRIALNFNQIEQYDPPPNPAKLTDSRCKSYISNYGKSSWELDALEPKIITDLINSAVEPLTDCEKLNARIKIQNEQRKEMRKYLDML